MITGEIPIRKCIKCDLESSDMLLFVADKSSKYGRRNLCYTCHKAQYKGRERDWKTRHQIYKRYKITPEQYKEHMATSDSCQICNTPNDLVYDHDHITMKFRGVLCRKCNRAIGMLGDTEDSIRRALEYFTH